MEKDEIIRLIAWLQSRVNLAKGENRVRIIFDKPMAADFPPQGFGLDVIGLTVEKDWWEEMATDIVDTPDFVGPDETPEQILIYARDVASEYVRKRLGS